MRSDRIPAEPFVSLLRAYLDAREGKNVDPEDRRAASHKEALCFVCKINPKMLSRLLSGSQQFIQFDTADRILVGLGLVDYWRGTSPFCDIYEEVDLTISNSSRPWVPETYSGVCLACSSSFEYFSANGRKRQYCSDRCRIHVKASKGGEAKAIGGRAAATARPMKRYSVNRRDAA